MRPFVLVNTNVVRPPVSPVGLEYLGESLRDTGVAVEVVDLALEPGGLSALGPALSRLHPLAVGLSVRNTDDCSLATGLSFLPWIGQVVAEVKRHTDAPVVLGGVGFSVAPSGVLEATGADMGIAGDGEVAAALLAGSLLRGEEPWATPGLVYQRGGRVTANPRSPAPLKLLPPPRRTLFDNRRYQDEGAIVGVETQRGCPRGCIYCADPVAKGRRLRLRPPATVATEFAYLVSQGVTYFHLCDSEFNTSLAHAKAVCRALIGAGLGEHIRWYTYCSPLPWDDELLRLMRRAGCAGINFGVDSLYDPQLRRLGREHRRGDVARLTAGLRRAGLNFMCDLLVGGPGEDEDSVRATVEEALRLELPLVGVAVGVRVYPGTPLSRLLAQDGAQDGSGLQPPQHGGLHQPVFYLSPALGGDTFALVRHLIGDDPRFLLLASPDEAGSYNYAGDDRSGLAGAIRRGARGAYWDILRQEMGHG
ncbi:MAG: radical SAM protein [Dehalococcoidia bacterium]